MAVTKVKLSDSNKSYTQTINDNFSDLDVNKVSAEAGKGLSTNDYTTAEKTKLAGIEAEADVNTIESVKVNGSALTPDASKAVDITVPTDVSDLNNDSGFITKDVNNLTNYTTTSNLNTSLALKLDKKPDGTNDLISNNKITLGYMPDAILGQVLYGGNVVPSTGVATLSTNAKTKLGTTNNTITLTNNSTAITGYADNEGIYYIASANGTFAGLSLVTGDWLISIGTAWAKVDNTDAVASVNSKTGTVVLAISDLTDDTATTPIARAVADAAGNTITTTYAKVADLATVATSGAYSDLTGKPDSLSDINSFEATKLEGIESNAQVNLINTVKVNGTALTPDANKTVDVSVPTAIFKTVKVGATNVVASSATDALELVAGSNVSLTADAAGKTVTIAATVPPGGTTIQTATFTSAQAGWSAIDADGNYTLTIANTGTPINVLKQSTSGGYEACMANIRADGTNFYVTADAKFDGMIMYY